MQENQNTQPEVQEQQDIISRPNHLKFLEVEIDNYAGLNYNDKALVVTFPDNQTICEVSGDQGAGKTSFLNALKSFMGEQEPANAINSTSNSKSGSLKFEVNNEIYRARITPKSFSLINIREGEGGKPVTSTINKPKDVLSSLIGPIGVSPAFIQKKKSGEDQIEWLKSLIGASNKEVVDLENETKQKHKSAYDDRTGVNSKVDSLKTEISSLGYYAYDPGAKDFVLFGDRLKNETKEVSEAPQNADEITLTYETARQRRSELERGAARKDQLIGIGEMLVREVENLQREIERLMALKSGKEKEIEDSKESVLKADEYIKERENAPQELEAAVKDMQDSGRIENIRKAISENDAKLKEYYVQRAEQNRLNDKLSEYERVMRGIAQAYTPPIEGLEIEPGGSIDNPRPIGAYYKGTNIAFLSESELWDLCLQIWKLTGTQVVFIENSTSLGSKAMERVNWFAQNGGKIFMSTLERSYKELKVEFLKTKE